MTRWLDIRSIIRVQIQNYNGTVNFLQRRVNNMCTYQNQIPVEIITEVLTLRNAIQNNYFKYCHTTGLINVFLSTYIQFIDSYFQTFLLNST